MAMATLSPSTMRANGSGSDAGVAPAGARPRSLQPAVGGGMTGRSDTAPGRDGRSGRAGPCARAGKGSEPVPVGGGAAASDEGAVDDDAGEATSSTLARDDADEADDALG